MNIAAPDVAAPEESALECAAELVSEREIAGFVFDPSNPERRFVVELWLDGSPTRLARANLHDPALAAQGRGDGCYRFVFALDAETVEGAAVAEARLANPGVAGRPPIRLAEAAIAPERQIGEARWIGGLRISGWIAWDPRAEGRVRAFIDGEEVGAGARAIFLACRRGGRGRRRARAST